MTKVILIGGKAQHGKDTFASYLKEGWEAEGKKVLIIHFADYLKFLCKQYFGWDGSKSEEGRRILQYVGTDLIRNRNPNFWLDTIVELIRVIQDDYDYILIPDTRFKNELSFKRGRNYWPVYSIRMERLNFESPLTSEQQRHASETDLDDNSIWRNHVKASSLEELQDNAKLYIKLMNEGGI